ncbi:uncharacterized protein TOT_040000457 [Theileria orientalis strain Shintoku]|uniref:Spindle pole body component n=1 Tax=Theileria orientalis strain Shintoku TaxID=869250 RepID=J4C4F2_THEOR|nr:uncharacterized protein TOT_040000457 [Theileria orientalis strain Shintoku]BAM42081.1 uncharacterized protein TOT_040000457 [Theileria orientalis strain Shintoku]|eukprot:XP_009692382.1 uncharacterized protein TOT_040000457 [Theileria orientalis strain Shintoku]
MDRECAVMLSSVTVSKENMNEDNDDLTRNWTQLSHKTKESNLVVDLINVLSGLESSFFTWTRNRETGKYNIFTNPLIQNDFEADVFEMCSAILDVRLHQRVLLDFIDQGENSFICQSISEVFLSVLEDLQDSLTKFHDKHLDSFLGIEKLFVYLKPATQTLSLLSAVSTDFDAEKLLKDKSNLGVLILNSLEQRCKGGVEAEKELCQYLYNVSMESYFQLIKNYVLYGSVNEHVADFFVKCGREREFLDQYVRVNRKDGESGLSEEDCDDDPDKVYFDEVGLWLDRRYVPSVLKDAAVKVFEAGVYLNVMNVTKSQELTFKNVEELIASLENIHTSLSNQLLEHLNDKSNIGALFKKFFDFYLCQRSDYVTSVIAMMKGNEELDSINEYLNEKKRKNHKCDKEGIMSLRKGENTPSSATSSWKEYHDISSSGSCSVTSSAVGTGRNSSNAEDDEYHVEDNGSDENGFLWVTRDNLKNLTDSLQFYKYYEHVNLGSEGNFNSVDLHYSSSNSTIDADGTIRMGQSSSNNVTGGGGASVNREARNGKFRCNVNWRASRLNNYNLEDSSDRFDSLVASDTDHRSLVLCCCMDRVSRLVFTRKVVYKYKLMFKLLFQLKYAEHSLNELSLHHMKTSRVPVEPELMGRLNVQVFTVTRMSHFVKSVLRHFLVDVVSVETGAFMSNVYGDVHALCKAHKALVDLLVEALLLRDAELISALQRVLLLIVKFATELLKFIDDPSYAVYHLKLDADGGLAASSSHSAVHLAAYNLNCLLRNPGYQNMVELSRTEFEGALSHFKSLLSRSDHSLRSAFE